MGYSTSSFCFWVIFLSFNASVSVYEFHVQVSENYLHELEGPSSTQDAQNLLRRTKRQTTTTPFFWNQPNNCLSQSSCSSIRQITSLAYGVKNVFYVATQSEIFKVQYTEENSEPCNCTVIHNGTDPVLTIVMDDQYLYWLAEIHKKVVFMPLSVGDEYPLLSRELSPEMFADDKRIHRAACMIPTYIQNPPLPYTITGTYAIFNLTKVKHAQQEWFNSNVCIREGKPTISFAFVYKNAKLSSENQCMQNKYCIFKNASYEVLNHIMLRNLQPATEYMVNIAVLAEANGHISAALSTTVRFVTACEVSSSPRNLTCNGVNDTTLRLSWNEPKAKNSAEILYQIYDETNQGKLVKESISAGGNGSFELSGVSYTEYNYSVRVYPVNCPTFANQFSEASITGCKPFQDPVKLEIGRVTDMEIRLYWKPPEDGSVQNVIIQWKGRKDIKSTWHSSRIIRVRGSFSYVVTDLLPNTGYQFCTRQQYVGYSGERGWLDSDVSTWKTEPGVPGFPRNVAVVDRDGRNFLTWSLPDDNGEQLESYLISYRNRSSPNATRTIFGKWKLMIHITARSTCGCEWEINKLPENVWYEFRVSAFNAVGEGDSSAPSKPFKYTVLQESQEVSMLWIIVGATGGLVVLIVILIFVVACRRCGHEPRTIYRSPSSSEITTIHLSYGKDLQLAQLRHMSELASIRGVESVPQDYMDLLPLFPREKLELTEFLGKGAFGEVFKGIARDIGTGVGMEQRVAVKTLREGSTDSEKCEFLMEAYFMSTFNHQNILSLIGVCLDNEPQYLIMELMEGGDLLRYLRDARPNPILGPKLTTTNLLDICLDVAAGCKYLEDQRFIHRDLAARNCLVSAKSFAAENRVVKIGDFGLARDIYKSDYYHKVGEGLLPVRWMAPESLVDNIYTTQSDVWAFGVLLWEIMNFGQQPYPTYTNIEVLHHIRAGGRLLRPENCPKDMYALMFKCWHITPTLRPSFSWALQWLQEFKHRNLGNVNSGSDYDLSPVNYTAVTTSDEDFVDDGIPTPNRSDSPPLDEHENTSVNQDNPVQFEAVVEIHQNPSFLDDEEDGTVFPLQAENYSSLPGNGSGYLHVSENSFAQMLADARSQLNDDEQTDESEESDNELNYSVLNFPPSRNQSQKSNVYARCANEDHCTCHLQTPVEEPCGRTLLPYMGDLPITDEERLYRKEQWNRRSRRQSIVNEIRGDVSEDPDEGLSPYLQSASNYAFVTDPSQSTSRRLSQSDITSPKQLAMSEESEDDRLSDVVDDSMASYSVFSGFPPANSQQSELHFLPKPTEQNEINLSERIPHANVPTYV